MYDVKNNCTRRRTVVLLKNENRSFRRTRTKKSAVETYRTRSLPSNRRLARILVGRKRRTGVGYNIIIIRMHVIILTGEHDNPWTRRGNSTHSDYKRKTQQFSVRSAKTDFEWIKRKKQKLKSYQNPRT